MEKLRISENGRYFVTKEGKPFTFIADTVWTMPQRIKWDDADYFMKTRKRQGFTVLQIVALDPERDVEMRSPSGDKALLNDDLRTPNERYFSYLDRILDMAESYGFYVLLLPVWGQLVVGENWMGETFPKTVTEENAYGYGEWIGNRYKDRKNILWCLGGDRQPIHKGVDYKMVWRKMAEGLAKGVLGKELHYNCPDPAWKDILITYHACHEMETGECSTMSYWTDEEAWIRFIMLQSGHGITPKNYELVAKEYNRENIMPVWDGEPAYEMMPTTWPVMTDFHGSWMVRKRAYFSLLAGSFGHTYGHCSVWCSISEREKDDMCHYTWYEALDSEGSGQIRHLRAFMDDLQIMTCIPCQELLPEEKEGTDNDQHIQACISPEEDFICVYLPSGGEVSVLVERLSEKEVWLWWYDPREGIFRRWDAESKELKTTEQAVRLAAEDGRVMLKSPTTGEEQDWIALLMKENGKVPVTGKTYMEEETKAGAKKVFEW